MKKIALLVLTFVFLIACKNDSKQHENENQETESKVVESSDNLKTIVGDFVYYADGAVLQAGNEVYTVIINEKMHELDKMAAPYKNEPTDYVKATVKAKIFPKAENEEGWPFKLDIKEIIKVEALDPEKNNVIKLGSE